MIPPLALHSDPATQTPVVELALHLALGKLTTLNMFNKRPVFAFACFLPGISIAWYGRTKQESSNSKNMIWTCFKPHNKICSNTQCLELLLLVMLLLTDNAATKPYIVTPCMHTYNRILDTANCMNGLRNQIFTGYFAIYLQFY